MTTEDLPDPDNRVTLHPTLTDSDGIPAPKLTYSLAPVAEQTIAHGIVNATRLMETAGAREVVPLPLINGAGFHLLGTARMGSDPASSVVDAGLPRPRRRQPLHRRRQRVRDVRRGQPDVDDHGHRAASRRPDAGPWGAAAHHDVGLLDGRFVVMVSGPTGIAAPTEGDGPLPVDRTDAADAADEARVDEAWLEWLPSVLDTLLPANEHLPAAGEMGLAVAVLDRRLVVPRVPPGVAVARR